jgi:alpha-methylacyl-CoA racemase
MSTLSGGPLAGLRVIEMAAIGPVPHCGMVLADMGAEVVRIDRPHAADLGIPVDPRFDVPARGKQSLILDLKASPAAALDLIDHADVLIEGFRPGVMERLGLGADICLARNQRLVYGRISGWGDSGEMAQLAGHDLNFIGMSGALAAMGAPGQPPPVPLNLIGDFGGGAMQLVAGILAALLHVAKTGQGQVVATSIFEGAHALTPFLHGLRAAGAWSDRRGTNVIDGGAPFYRCYPAAEFGTLAVAAIEPKFYASLVKGLELDGVLDLAAQMDRQTWPATAALFAEKFATRSRDAWAAHFAGTDACVTPVLDWAEAAAHPQAAALGVFEAPEGVVQPRTAPRFSATPAIKLRPPPGSG